MRNSQEVCRLTAVTQLCTLCLWMHRQPLTMTHCTCGGVLTPSRSESHKNRKKKRPGVGPCLLFTVLRVAPGPEKTGAEKHFVLVGRLLLWFCNRHHYQGPWSLCREGRGGGRKKVCYSTRYTKRGSMERKRCGRLAACLSALFSLFYQLSCSAPPPGRQLTQAVWGVVFLSGLSQQYQTVN